MNKKRVLTPELIANVAAARAAGASYADIQRRFDVSPGTVTNALKEAKAKKPTPAPLPAALAVVAPPTSTPDAVPAPPTREDLVSFLSAQAEQLKTEIKATTEPTARAALNRNLTTVHALVARLLPPPPLDPNVGVFVTAEDMNAAAARVRKRWHDMADSLVRVSQSPVGETIAKMLKEKDDDTGSGFSAV